jgi:hypothetical protein
MNEPKRRMTILYDDIMGNPKLADLNPILICHLIRVGHAIELGAGEGLASIAAIARYFGKHPKSIKRQLLRLWTKCPLIVDEMSTEDWDKMSTACGLCVQRTWKKSPHRVESVSTQENRNRKRIGEEGQEVQEDKKTEEVQETNSSLLVRPVEPSKRDVSVVQQDNVQDQDELDLLIEEPTGPDWLSKTVEETPSTRQEEIAVTRTDETAKTVESGLATTTSEPKASEEEGPPKAKGKMRFIHIDDVMRLYGKPKDDARSIDDLLRDT